MNRTQLYLGGLLVVQVALILLFRSPFAGASTPAEARPLWPELASMTADRVEMLGKDDASLRLARTGDGWVVESLGGFPADETKVDGLLEKLQELRVRRPVVSSGRYHDTFKVAEEEFEGRLRLWSDAAGDPEIDLFLGTSPNFRTAHVRRADDDAVYEVRGLSSYDLRPEAGGWIERQLVDVEESRIVGFTLTNAAGSFELRKTDGDWLLVDASGTTLDRGKVDAFVRAMSSLRLDDAVGPLDAAAHGFAEPAARLVLRIAEDDAVTEGEPLVRELTIEVGAVPADDDSRRYIAKKGLPFTGSIWESSVKQLLEETAGNLSAS